MSTINTNGIDVNYPVPGVNNNSQGFRNNFAAIKTNLDTGASEITDLQNKAVLKAALANTTLNNDMANTLISNALTRSFRASTYNLGNALSGTVLVNASLGDVQYGNIAGDITLQFGFWAPVGTEQKIMLNLGVSNRDAVISFPGNVVSNSSGGLQILENYANISNVGTISFPNDVDLISIECSTTDCGNTIYLDPVNRPFQSTQVIKKTPPITGEKGDAIGKISIDTDPGTELTISSSTSSDFLVTGNTATLYTGMPVILTGTSFESNLVPGVTYYVGNIANSTHFKLSSYANAFGNVNLNGGTGNLFLNPIRYMYVAVDDYSSNTVAKTILSTTAPNIITLSSTSNVAVSYPVIFSGNNVANANLVSDQVYYVKSLSGSNITLSETIDNGVSGAEFNNIATYAVVDPLTFGMEVYDGTDIFRRIPLAPGTIIPNSLVAPNISNVKIYGGTNGYVLTTDGAGNLSFTLAGGSGNGMVGGSNTQIQFNNAGSFAGSSNLTFNTTTSNLTVTGNINSTQSLTAADFTLSNSASITGNLIAGNLQSSANILATANLTANNITSNNTLTTIAIESTGNANIGNLSVTGIANANGNIFSNSYVIANINFVSQVANTLTSAGSTQGTALALAKPINVVTTVAASTGVILPVALQGTRIIVRNAGANALNVYPDSGGTINALGLNSAYSLSTATSIEFFCTTSAPSSQWYTL